MNTPTIATAQKRRLQSHFGFMGVPFRKNVAAHKMFDSRAQRDLGHALVLWTEIRGLSLVTGPIGVGKSIAVRRFARELDETRFSVIRFNQVPMTPMGFLRSLNRLLGLPMRRHVADLFDQARDHLRGYSEAHPILILDDVEGVQPATLDLIRRLTAANLDVDDRFSVLLVGTEEVLQTLQHPSLGSLRSRFGYACQLRPFSLEDTLNYVRFHLTESGRDAELLTDDAVRHIFQASQGAPRLINQLALQALIQAAVKGRDGIDGRYMSGQIAAHPLYTRGER